MYTGLVRWAAALRVSERGAVRKIKKYFPEDYQQPATGHDALET